MAHTRKRHIEPYLKKILAYSPIVGVLGHRQVGKTTLLEQLSSQYFTMDTKVELETATNDPDAYVDRFDQFPVGIDECQLCPPLFPALKDRVRRVKRPGQFLLTGSVRFTSRKAIRESLTGRIITVELHPLMVSELIESGEPQIAREFIESKNLNLDTLMHRFKLDSSILKKSKKSLLGAMQTGGLPGVCFIRDAGIRSQKFESQLETILARDLKQLIETTLSFDTLKRVLENLVLLQGQPLEMADLARKTRVSIPALRRLIDAFESLFLLWRIPCVGGEKRPSLFFEDSGEAFHLSRGRLDELSVWTSTIATQVRSIFDLPLAGTPGIAHFFQYRTRGGAYVPIVVEQGARSLGIIPILSHNPTPQELGSAKSFLSAIPNSRIAFVSPQCESKVISKNAYLLSGGLFLL